MKSGLTAEEPVKAVLRAVRFCSDARYAWMGKRIPPIPAWMARTSTEQIRREWTLLHLKSRIYNDFYCAGAPRPATAVPVPYPGRAMTPFMRRLSAANHGRGQNSSGWAADARTDALVVSKGDLRLWVRPGPHLGDLRADGRATLIFPKELLNISPGFYVAVGDRDVEAVQEGVLLRFYFNLTPDGAISFLDDATRSLNQGGLAFRIKAVNDPERFGRCDAVVLYVWRADCSAVSAIIARAYPRFAEALKGPAPPFTKALAPGIGLAEDPGGGESFGAHRSRMLAEALVEAHARGQTTMSGRLEVVREWFELRHIQFDRPYLTVSGVDDYDVIATPAARRARPPVSGVAPLEAAAAIGSRLVRAAIWRGQACNWVSAEPEGPEAGRGWSSGKVFAALGANLYAGLSGVALFLAELSVVARDAAARRCALGAMRQALDRIEIETDFGLYTGSLGVAWAAVRIGFLLGEAEFAERGAALAGRASATLVPADGGEADLLSGTAGAIVALLAIAEFTEEAALTERAGALGDALLRMAEVDTAAMSWTSPVQRRGRNLTGFAHGAAGVGFALARLFAGAGLSAYGEAAERAFAYERRWFDAKAGNWRDLRDADPRESLGRGRGRRFAIAWCHGAPGVALSRLQAFEATGDALCRAEALTALRTTAEHTKLSLAARERGGCLCHGLAGNSDILLSGARVLDGDFPEGEAIARSATDAILAAAGEDEPLGLMVGVAGRGYALLRQHDPAVPSVLALGAK